MTNYTFFPVLTQSGGWNNSLIVMTPSVMTIGGVAPNLHGFVRFNTLTLGVTNYVVESKFRVKFAGKSGTNPDVVLWASEFSSVVSLADYGLSATNTTPFRVFLDEIFLSTAVAGDVNTLYVPTRFVTPDANSFADFELRPGVATAVGTDNSQVYGPGAIAADNSPSLLISTLTPSELIAQNDYRTQAIGDESFVAFGMETVAGTAVKPDTILDATDIGLDSYAENIVSNALNRERAAPRKAAVGRAGAGGPVTFELTPEKCWKLLVGLMKKTSTTGSNPYTHTFKTAQSSEIKTFTFVTKSGDFRFVYAGGMVGSLDVSADLDRVAVGSIDVMCRSEFRYVNPVDTGANDEYIIGATAGYDSISNGLLSFVDSYVSFGGATDRGLVQNFRLMMNNNVRERRGLSQKREVTSHFPGKFMVDLSFSMYFENEALLNKFLGIDSGVTLQKPRKKVIFDNVSFVLEDSTQTKRFTFSIPKTMYTSIRKPIGSGGEIMLECAGVAMYDESTASNLAVTVLNAESGTQFDPLTDNITVLPSE